jgi:hypothetical protein
MMCTPMSIIGPPPWRSFAAEDAPVGDAAASQRLRADVEDLAERAEAIWSRINFVFGSKRC